MEVVSAQMEAVLVPYGFQANGRLFRLRSSLGDWLVVDLQPSDGSIPERPRFFINVGFTLWSRWSWDRSYFNLAEAPKVEECIWKTRVRPEPANGSSRWEMRPGPAAEAVLEALARVLDREVGGFVRLLDRSFLRDLVDQELGLDYATWQVKAWLLAEEGRVDELEEFLNSMEAEDGDPLFEAMRELAYSKGDSSS
ncbi:DUF4304 domain-containing protein [Micromonospora sp. WMMA2032]|uniref:DUF4304 domain-containing protein n=1 Tax=Micromonospora sp. WMMA2032 TaxID=2039870 RepID=UPI001561CD0F|nr:DUF4304 domain-containing protein [Micromonospora sp. WMMA2032]